MEGSDSLSLKVYFRQDVARIEQNYRNNACLLEGFISNVKAMINDPSYHIQDIRIRSAASPEGSFNHNMDLSWRRGHVVKEYLQSELLLPDDKFCIEAVGEDWQGLREKVERNNVPDKEKILEILDRHSDFVNGTPTSYLGSPKKDLMDLNGGKTWFWLLENIYPDLRNAGNSIICHYYHHEELVAATVPASRIDTLYIIEQHYYRDTTGASAASAGYAGASPYDGNPHPRVKRERKGPGYRFAIRSNLLFDLILSPNIGVEFPVGKHVSILANHNFPWYTWNNDRFAYQLMNTSIEGRFWLGDRTKRSVLTGGYVGLYGAVGKGDLEYSSAGYQVPSAWHAGVTGGWSLPLGKNDNWRLDFGLGLGFAPIAYDYYERSETSGKLIYKSSGKRNWIGPTNIRCSIVWILPMNKKGKDQKEEQSKERNR